MSDIPEVVFFRRQGVEGELQSECLNAPPETIIARIQDLLPRIELIDPITTLSDSVTAEELEPGKNEFMRGIFYYAGLDPDNSTSLFDQTDRSERQVSDASARLNETLKQSWTQGSDLDFKLLHKSKADSIELKIKDPSVQSTYVRASQRSSGFTHYFSLKTILHSRQKDHPASSYILLFDEPGVFLHPLGQFDLLQVLETLAQESQVVYVTHSLFMINKTFPTRHRLVMKNESGTVIDGKPYVGRWRAVVGALGLTLTGSILFANHVVLTEGDSDPIYIYAMMQKYVESGKSDLDINSLAVMSTAESRNTDVLVRLLCESKPKPRIALLTDGDQGGKERLAYVKTLIQDNEVEGKTLAKDTTIEDHIPMIREIYVPALASYIANVMVGQGQPKPDDDDFRAKFVKSFDERFGSDSSPKGVADWAAESAKELGKLKKPPSKVGIAREYATRLTRLQ